VVVPDNTEQLSDIVKQYYARAKTGVPVTIRCSRQKFHSSAPFPCATPTTKAPAITQETGPAKANGALSVGVLHTKFDKVIAVKPMGPYTLTVGAGMDVNKFAAAATKVKMSVQVGSLTAYAGLTLAGILSTSAHGSGYGTTSMLADTVLAVKIVDGTGAVHIIKKGDPDFRMLNGGLGLVGIITEITFQMTAPTNTQLFTLEKVDDNNLANDVQKMFELGKHVLIFWRPDIGKYTSYITREAPKDIKPNPNARMTLLPNLKGRPNVSKLLSDFQELVPEDVEAVDLACSASGVQALEFSWASVGNKPAVNVTGFTNKMQASECDAHCLWNDLNVTGGTAQDVEFTADFKDLPSWISAVKRIFQKDMWEDGKARYRCLGPGYLWIRFGHGDDSYLSTMHGIEHPVYLQSTWLRARKNIATKPIEQQYVLDLIEEVTLCKFGGRPHWGKNFERTFTHPKCPVRPKYKNFGKALEVAKKYDPLAMYQPALFKKVASGTPYSYFPRCTLKQQCFCTENIHCPEGFTCVPAKSFPEFKVCKYLGPPAKNGTIDMTPLFDALSALSN